MTDFTIPMPTSADQAEAMQKLGFAWLKEHAPERLTPEGLAAPMPQGTGVVPDFAADLDINCDFIEWDAKDGLTMLDGSDMFAILTVNTLIRGPDYWAVRLPVEDDQEFLELHWFASLEEAIAAGGHE